MKMHANQLTVSPETVRRLVEQQFPEWRSLPVTSVDDLEWERGKAWAFAQAMGLVWYYVKSNAAMSRMGRRSLERILADNSLA
ncbi:hypothetical protein EV646_10255 [Kribbella antiqua]|uniref:Uncharacterized protein n=1 Tax=Kribbella antiqua TaxID=2512217 RepID=A0A4R2IWP0_9ACTN|nr:hypothetical protein [Kribbella antiqua]TCO49984.1 hypothetical protein EV646_10255 [Kribbella antiqua]